MNVTPPTDTARSKRADRRPTRAWYHYSNWLWIFMVLVILAGSLYPLVGLAVALCFAAAVFTAPFLGRMWCGRFCPRGNFWDRVLAKLILKPRMPRWATNKAVRVGVFILLMGVMTVQLKFAWGDWEAVGRVFVVLLTVTTAVGVFMALTGHQRAWCKVCPAGTLAYWLGRGKGPQLRIDHKKCTQCQACCSVCPMDLRPYEMAAHAPSDADCLKCTRCVYRCPTGALTLELPRKNDTVLREGKAA